MKLLNNEEEEGEEKKIPFHSLRKWWRKPEILKKLFRSVMSNEEKPVMKKPL